jgi:predicted nucleic acid-binding protein
VARWTGRGLTAYDAAYVAVAEAEAVRLVTDDDLIVNVAPEISIALTSAAPASN